MEEGLYQKLAEYETSDYYPFHMPGHKRNLRLFSDPFGIDITEIENFDNLHHAEGILLEGQRRAARLYGAEESFFLVNGSSCGILAAVSAAVKRGGRIVMARNCHKASYHAAFLNGLGISYLYPEMDLVRGIAGSISPEAVREALRREPGAEAVLLTSPTYDGVVSDIESIAEIVHEAGAVLIVDGAHGAHFGMHPCFPANPLGQGADLVINSVHKTLPSLTQTALLHVQGDRVDRDKLKKYLGIYQSSSPSYVLMASIDSCIRLLEQQGDALFETFACRLGAIRKELGGLKKLHLVTGRERELECFGYDISKILISTENCGIGGTALSGMLRKRYHLELEMEAEHYVTAITTVADTQEGLDRLSAALREIDRELEARQEELETRQEELEAQQEEPEAQQKELEARQEKLETRQEELEAQQEAQQEELEAQQEELEAHQEKLWAEPMNAAFSFGNEDKPGTEFLPRNEEVLSITQAEEAEKVMVPLDQSAGRVSGEYVYLYPPGIPLLVPGERIPAQLPEKLREYVAAGLKLQGLADYQGKKIRVVPE